MCISVIVHNTGGSRLYPCLGQEGDYPFLESVVATFHLIALEADKGSANESRDEKNSADKAPTMETSTGRLS